MDWPKPKKRVGRGGYREGSGRPKGSTKAAKSEERRRASLTGDLPHQFLLRIMRGEVIYVEGKAVKADLPTRIDCAKAAAPYYAPKLAQVQVLESLSDDDLDFIIKNAAAEAGIVVGPTGESAQGGDTPGAGEAPSTVH